MEEVSPLNGDCTLNVGEIHPMAEFSCKFILDFRKNEKEWKEVKRRMNNGIRDGDRKSAICYETLRRIETDEKIEHTYAMGLAWYLVEFLTRTSAYDLVRMVSRKKERKKKNDKPAVQEV